MENNIIGIIRIMDDLGRVVIPKEYRRATNIKEGDSFEIFATSDNTLILRKATVKEVDGVMVKVETTVAPVATPTPSNKHTYYFQNEYDDNEKHVFTINDDQDKLLDWLCENDLISSDYIIERGLPDIEIADLT